MPDVVKSLGGMRIDRLHIIDFEGHARYGVVEYGVVTWTAQGIVGTKSRLCAPMGEIPPADTRVHGITVGETEGRAPFAEDYALFVELRRSGLFCAHNAVVESNLLRGTWACPPFSPDWGNTEGAVEVAEWGPWLDTLQLARALFPDRERHALGELSYETASRDRIDALAAEHCAAPRRRPHAALFDALATTVWLEEAVGWERAIEWFQRSRSSGRGGAMEDGQGELFG
jgi:DNA polymerase-3 subunit epsilon